MNNFMKIILASAITACLLPANTTQERKGALLSADTTGVQEHKLKEQGRKQKAKEQRSVKKALIPGIPDSLKIIFDRPLLRLKDSSQNSFR